MAIWSLPILTIWLIWQAVGAQIGIGLIKKKWTRHTQVYTSIYMRTVVDRFLAPKLTSNYDYLLSLNSLPLTASCSNLNIKLLLNDLVCPEFCVRVFGMPYAERSYLNFCLIYQTNQIYTNGWLLVPWMNRFFFLFSAAFVTSPSLISCYCF